MRFYSIFVLSCAAFWTAQSYSVKDSTPVGGSQSIVRSEVEEVQEEAPLPTEPVLAEQDSQTAEEVEKLAEAAALAEAQASLPDTDKQKEAFLLLDQDGSGAIDSHDLKDVMRTFAQTSFVGMSGTDANHEVLDDLLSTADMDGDGQVTFPDYQQFLLELAHMPHFANMFKAERPMSILSVLNGIETADRQSLAASEVDAL